MSWWTTVLGGAVGFMIGGPLGAMLGVAFAGNFLKASPILVDPLKYFTQETSSAFRRLFLVAYFQLWAIWPKSMARFQSLKFS